MASQERIQQLQEEIAQHEAQPNEGESEAFPVLVFLLAGERYAFPLHTVREVSRVGRITPLPGLPAPVLGATGLRGEVLPVVDLRRLLHLAEEPPTPASRLIVVEQGTTLAALLADQVEDIAELPRTALQPPPPSTDSGEWALLEGIAHVGGQTTRLLDLARLLEAVRHAA